jgi:hypothetical protein
MAARRLLPDTVASKPQQWLADDGCVCGSPTSPGFYTQRAAGCVIARPSAAVGLRGRDRSCSVLSNRDDWHDFCFNKTRYEGHPFASEPDMRVRQTHTPGRHRRYKEDFRKHAHSFCCKSCSARGDRPGDHLRGLQTLCRGCPCCGASFATASTSTHGDFAGHASQRAAWRIGDSAVVFHKRCISDARTGDRDGVRRR